MRLPRRSAPLQLCSRHLQGQLARPSHSSAEISARLRSRLWFPWCPWCPLLSQSFLWYLWSCGSSGSRGSWRRSGGGTCRRLFQTPRDGNLPISARGFVLRRSGRLRGDCRCCGEARNAGQHSCPDRFLHRASLVVSFCNRRTAQCAGRRHSMRMLVFGAVSHAVRWRHCCCDRSQAHRNHHSASVVA